MGNTTPSWGRPPQAYIMKVLWLIEGLQIASTKNLSILFCVHQFCPRSLFQPPIMFSLHPGSALRCSWWPCQPRTTLRRALPYGAAPGGAIQGDRREFAQHPEVGGQTAIHRGQTTSLCLPIARLHAWPV
jgi:hypothetical protein